MNKTKKRKIGVLQVIMVLKYGGSEKLATLLACSIDRSRFDTSVLGLYGGGPLSKELQYNCVPYHLFEYKDGLDEKYRLQYRIYDFCRQHNPDIIQVHGSYPFTRMLPVAAITNSRIIYTVHSKYTLQTVPRLRLMVRIGSVFCDKVVVVSNDLQRFMAKSVGISQKRITVIYNGVDLNKFSLKGRNRQDPASKMKSDGLTLVGVVGRLTDAKDHAGLFKAWAQVYRKQPAARLVLAGDGELRQQLEQLVSNLGITDSVVFLGDREDIPNIISSMDLMLLPSKREGFPISLLESMAMKKPVIATAVGGVPEIIGHGVNGYLVPPQNPDALANAILKFLDAPSLFEAMAVEGYHTVIQNFSDKIVINKYEQLYNEICPV